MRLIDADKLLTKAVLINNLKGQVAWSAVPAIAILAAPAVDAAPVRHGRWECQKSCPVCGEDRFKGLDADIWADWEPPYCPNCGAKMNGG